MQCVFINKKGVVKKSSKSVGDCKTFLLVSAEDNINMENLVNEKVDLIVSSMFFIGCAIMFAIGWACHEWSAK